MSPRGWFVDVGASWAAVHNLGCGASVEGTHPEMRAWAEALIAGTDYRATETYRCAVRWEGGAALVSSPRNSISPARLDRLAASLLGEEVLHEIANAPAPSPQDDES